MMCMHLEGMWREHLQDAKEHDAVKWVGSAVSFNCPILSCTAEKGRNTFVMKKLCRFNLGGRRKCIRGLSVAARGLEISFRNAFVYARLRISRHSSVLLFSCCRNGSISQLEGRALACLATARTWLPYMEAPHDAKSALFSATCCKSQPMAQDSS